MKQYFVLIIVGLFVSGCGNGQEERIKELWKEAKECEQRAIDTDIGSARHGDVQHGYELLCDKINLYAETHTLLMKIHELDPTSTKPPLNESPIKDEILRVEKDYNDLVSVKEAAEK